MFDQLRKYTYSLSNKTNLDIPNLGSVYCLYIYFIQPEISKSIGDNISILNKTGPHDEIMIIDHAFDLKALKKEINETAFSMTFNGSSLKISLNVIYSCKNDSSYEKYLRTIDSFISEFTVAALPGMTDSDIYVSFYPLIYATDGVTKQNSPKALTLLKDIYSHIDSTNVISRWKGVYVNVLPSEKDFMNICYKISYIALSIVTSSSVASVPGDGNLFYTEVVTNDNNDLTNAFFYKVLDSIDKSMKNREISEQDILELYNEKIRHFVEELDKAEKNMAIEVIKETQIVHSFLIFGKEEKNVYYENPNTNEKKTRYESMCRRALTKYSNCKYSKETMLFSICSKFSFSDNIDAAYLDFTDKFLRVIKQQVPKNRAFMINLIRDIYMPTLTEFKELFLRLKNNADELSRELRSITKDPTESIKKLPDLPIQLDKDKRKFVDNICNELEMHFNANQQTYNELKSTNISLPCTLFNSNKLYENDENGKKKLVNNTKLFNGNYMTGYTTKYIDSVNPYFFIDTKEE